MARPSDAMLTWLRKLADNKDLNTAQLAERSGLPRARVRKILTGSEPMLVDELVQLTNALQISPKDMGLPDTGAEAEPGEPETPDEVAGPKVDPWGNHPEQLFRIGFGLGCDFYFLAKVELLQDSGIPEPVLKQYENGDLPIRLDAAFHSYNAPRYDDDGVTIALSFDAVYDCRFPWAAIKQVIFFPAPWEPADRDRKDEPEKPSGRPHLRLVE